MVLGKKARKFLKRINLDYKHGTGHGVGFFSNVHEGPQSISKYNNGSSTTHGFRIRRKA